MSKSTTAASGSRDAESESSTGHYIAEMPATKKQWRELGERKQLFFGDKTSPTISKSQYSRRIRGASDPAQGLCSNERRQTRH